MSQEQYGIQRSSPQSFWERKKEFIRARFQNSGKAIFTSFEASTHTGLLRASRKAFDKVNQSFINKQ